MKNSIACIHLHLFLPPCLPLSLIPSLTNSQDAEIIEKFQSDWRVVQERKHRHRPTRTSHIWSTFSHWKEGKVSSQICWVCNPCHPSPSCSLCHHPLVLLQLPRYSSPLLFLFCYPPFCLFSETIQWLIDCFIYSFIL